MRATSLLGPFSRAFIVALFWAFPAVADGIRWRQDYEAARREAYTTGRPLFLDFGSEDCFWCKRQDATTLRDPEIAHILNTRFIPVKIDGEKQAALTEALHIQSFPALVLAAPNGKSLGFHEGYASTSQCRHLLERALLRLKEMADASRATVGMVARGAQPEEPAAETAKQVVRTTALPAGAAEPVSDRVRLARELLSQAEEDHRAHRFSLAEERCRVVAAAFPDLAEAETARQLSSRIHAESAVDGGK